MFIIMFIMLLLCFIMFYYHSYYSHVKQVCHFNMLINIDVVITTVAAFTNMV